MFDWLPGVISSQVFVCYSTLQHNRVAMTGSATTIESDWMQCPTHRDCVPGSMCGVWVIYHHYCAGHLCAGGWPGPKGHDSLNWWTSREHGWRNRWKKRRCIDRWNKWKREEIDDVKGGDASQQPDPLHSLERERQREGEDLNFKFHTYHL